MFNPQTICGLNIFADPGFSNLFRRFFKHKELILQIPGSVHINLIKYESKFPF